MDSEGKLYMLEVNPLPGMFYPCDYKGYADLVVTKAPGGHAEFLERAMQAAIKRFELRQLNWVVVDELPLGFCCKATKPLMENEAIHDFMRGDVKLGTMNSLARTAGLASQVRNNRFYLPVSDDLVITSDNEQDNYKFLQPSEDPNCWLDGLKITARKAILAGEVLTFDYCTLYGDDWQNLTGNGQSKFDWQFVTQKYPGHVSKFVEKMASQQQ